MNKKLVGIIFVMLLIGTVLPVTAVNGIMKELTKEIYSELLPNERVDQQQITHGSESAGAIVTKDQWLAQSFTPSIGEISSVELKMVRFNGPNYDLIFSIRMSLSGEDFVKVVKRANEIENGRWTKFDFVDINVEAYSKYYLVCTADSGSLSKCIAWYYSEDNPYNKGILKVAHDQGNTWSTAFGWDCCFKTFYQYDPPFTPQKPTGETKCKDGVEYQYSTTTTDFDPSDELYYMWDWGDGNFSEWLGPYLSGQTAAASHVWEEREYYEIKVKARDRCVESGWSEPLGISVPKNKLSVNTPFLNFLDNHLHLFLILRQLFGL